MILKLLITRGNITVIPREAKQETENLKMQPEKVKKKEKQEEKFKKKNDSHTNHKRGVTENMHDILLSILL